MVEGSKQVRVDNWGIFFLQRLQMFFSKTDFCDLTLQFEGNVQLKVHRLVMNACTEYFSFLEESYPSLEENTIIMPSDLQADVIVPIVNFMYTGMLEFHSTIFEKLYRASEVMNLTVLTKLLDAQKQKVASTPPLTRRKHDSSNQWLPPKKTPKSSNNLELPSTLPGRKLPVWKRKMIPAAHYGDHKWSSNTEVVSSFSVNTPKPTRFEWPEDDLPTINLLDTSFEEFSYTSKPLLTQEEEIRSGTLNRPSSSKGNDNNTLTDLCIFEEEEDVSEFGQKRKLDQSASKASPKRLKMNDKENKETTFNVKSNNSADLDHTKIVSEILKKYPELVKKNKNIRLKIMSPGSKNATPEKKANSVTKVKIEEEIQIKSAIQKQPSKPKLRKRQTTPDEGPWICEECSARGGDPQEFVLYYLYRKHMTDVHSKVFDMRLCKYCGKHCGKHRLMMYHLYVKHGLKPPSSYEFPQCDSCPYIGLSFTKLIQHQRRHKPGEAQCLDCKLAFCNQIYLTTHMRASGHSNIENRPSHYDCQYCTKRMPSAIGLLGHVRQSHIKDAARDGMIGLEEELDDDEEEDEEPVKEEEEYIVPDVGVEAEVGDLSRDKVKIISNVKVTDNQQPLPSHQLIPAEPSSEAEALNNVASGIATSLGLVDIVVLDDDRQYVLRQSGEGNHEFVLPSELAGNTGFAGQVITTQHSTSLQQGVLQTTASEIGSTDELVMVLTDHDYQDEQDSGTTDNSNIVVLYSHPVDGQQGQFITSQGNLLVNSQTGMLEIRNGATSISTNSSNQMIVNSPTDAPIESIEMIQREIQSHNQLKAEPYFEDESKSHSETQPYPVSEPTTMNQRQELLDHSSQDLVPSTETDQQDSKTLSLPEDNTSIETNNEEANNEDTDNKNTNNVVILDVDAHIEEEQTIEEIGDIQDEDLSKKHDQVIEDGARDENKEKDHVQHEINVKDNVEQDNEKDSVDAATSITHEESMEVDEVSETQISIAELNESEKEPNVVQVQTEDIPLPDRRTEDQEQTENIAPVEEVESSIDIPPQPKSAHPIEDPDEKLTLSNVIVNDPNIECSIESDDVEDTCEPMEVDGKITNLEADSKELAVEDSKNQELTVKALQDKEILQKLQLEQNTQKDQQVENADIDKEVEHSGEENGCQSEIVKKTNKNRGNINQTILDDWEDTDSQQSEKPHSDLDKDDNEAMKEAAENVNKLMDDWEEEEEDDKTETVV